MSQAAGAPWLGQVWLMEVEGLGVVIPQEEEQERAKEGTGCGSLTTLAMGHLVGLGGTEERAVGGLGGCPCALVGEEMRWHQKWVAELCGSAGPWGRSLWKGMRRLVEGVFCPTQDDVGQRAHLLLCCCVQSQRRIH